MKVTIRENHGKKHLVVDGQPFLMLAGETRNSSSSSLDYMEGVWQKADDLGLNTVLLPITWELFEPKEGVFDYTLVDGIIQQARQQNKKIGLLWFGAWKNAQCMYAPSWVKSDLKRFKRAEVEKGKYGTHLKEFYGMPYSTLSYLCDETNKADTNAFCALMAHIKEVDEEQGTVIAIQVENEPGLQGAAREQSDKADSLFTAEVPPSFVQHMMANTDTMALDVRKAVEQGAKEGNWKEVFGEVADEIFSAYYVASYIEKLTAAGKKIYGLPMFVNCWLDKGEKPGKYPSGGPVARMMEVWKYAAPSIDVFGADIYVQDFLDTCDLYVKLGNPLLIPETAAHKQVGPRLVYMVGHYHACGFAPFAFEDMGNQLSAIDGYLFGIDINDPNLDILQDVKEYQWINETLHSLTPLLAKYYGTKNLQAIIHERPEVNIMDFDSFSIQAGMEKDPRVMRKDGVCLALKAEDNEFYIIANGCSLNFISNDPEKPFVDFLAYEEGVFLNGEWQRKRRLNGDEAASRIYNEPTLLRAKLFAHG